MIKLQRELTDAFGKAVYLTLEEIGGAGIGVDSIDVMMDTERPRLRPELRGLNLSFAEVEQLHAMLGEYLQLLIAQNQ